MSSLRSWAYLSAIPAHSQGSVMYYVSCQQNVTSHKGLRPAQLKFVNFISTCIHLMKKETLQEPNPCRKTPFVDLPGIEWHRLCNSSGSCFFTLDHYQKFNQILIKESKTGSRSTKRSQHLPTRTICKRHQPCHNESRFKALEIKIIKILKKHTYIASELIAESVLRI